MPPLLSDFFASIGVLGKDLINEYGRLFLDGDKARDH